MNSFGRVHEFQKFIRKQFQRFLHVYIYKPIDATFATDDYK